MKNFLDKPHQPLLVYTQGLPKTYFETGEDMFLTVEVEPEDVIESLFQSMDHEELLGVVKSLDLRIADMGFTEELLKLLIESSEGDMKGNLDKDDYKEYKEVSKKFLAIWDKID